MTDTSPVRTGPRRLLPSLLVALTLALSACGGGGGDSAEPTSPVVPEVPATPPAPPPIAEVVGPGELKQATPVNTLSAAEITAAAAAPGSKAPPFVAKYAVSSTRLTYETLDSDGRQVTASGLVSVPVKAAGNRSPIISYQHGTIFNDAEAPSNNVVAGEPPIVMASLGYIVVAPDYVGYGASKGTPHPYLKSAPTASAVIDLLTAAALWRQREGIADNGQLFLVGYSEGGYATMAAHRALQAGDSLHKPTLVGSVPGAGPYNLGITLGVLIDRLRDDNPVLGALINPGFLRHLGSTVRDEVRRQLVKALIPDDADVVFDTRFIDLLLADDAAALERDYNVDDWTPATPLRMFHGRDDRTVPYTASTHALQTMLARGASTATLTDCASTPAGHQECVPPYFAFMIEQLAKVADDL